MLEGNKLHETYGIADLQAHYIFIWFKKNIFWLIWELNFSLHFAFKPLNLLPMCGRDQYLGKVYIWNIWIFVSSNLYSCRCMWVHLLRFRNWLSKYSRKSSSNVCFLLVMYLICVSKSQSSYEYLISFYWHNREHIVQLLRAVKRVALCSHDLIWKLKLA